MSQTPDPEHRSAEEKHPEVFHDRDAGQVFPEDNRPPEPVVISGLKKGCLWAIVFTTLLLLIIALAWQWGWNREPPDAMQPSERDPTGAPIRPSEPVGDTAIVDQQEGETDGAAP